MLPPICKVVFDGGFVYVQDEARARSYRQLRGLDGAAQIFSIPGTQQIQQYMMLMLEVQSRIVGSRYTVQVESNRVIGFFEAQDAIVELKLHSTREQKIIGNLARGTIALEVGFLKVYRPDRSSFFDYMRAISNALVGNIVGFPIGRTLLLQPYQYGTYRAVADRIIKAMQPHVDHHPPQ